MAEISEIEKEFVERTLATMNNLEPEHDFSFVINCAFGLVIFPFAVVEFGRKKKEGPWKETDHWKTSLVNSVGLPQSISKRLGQNDGFPQTVGELLDRVRNALCHQKPKIINSEGKIAAIKLNVAPEQQPPMLLELAKQDLNELITFIARTYLESPECKNPRK